MFFLHWNGSFFRRLDTPHETMMWWRWWWWWSCFCTPITINKKYKKSSTTCILTRKKLYWFFAKKKECSETIHYILFYKKYWSWWYLVFIYSYTFLCALLHITWKRQANKQASNIFAYEVLCIKHNGFLPSYPTYSFHQHHHGSSVIRPYSIQNSPSFSFSSFLFVGKLGDWRGEI